MASEGRAGLCKPGDEIKNNLMEALPDKATAKEAQDAARLSDDQWAEFLVRLAIL